MIGSVGDTLALADVAIVFVISHGAVSARGQANDKMGRAGVEPATR